MRNVIICAHTHVMVVLGSPSQRRPVLCHSGHDTSWSMGLWMMMHHVNGHGVTRHEYPMPNRQHGSNSQKDRLWMLAPNFRQLTVL